MRDEMALAKLPEGERAEWRALWADVERTLEKARAVNGPQKPGPQPPAGATQ